MSPRAAALLLPLILAAGAAGLWALHSPVTSASAPELIGPTDFPRAQAALFRVVYRADTRIDLAAAMGRPGADALEGRLSLEAEIALSRDADGVRIAVDDVSAAEIRAGADVVGDPSLLVGVRCHAAVDPQGHPGTLRCAPNTAPLAHHLLAAVVADLVAIPRAGAAVRRTSLATGSFDYAATADGLEGTRTVLDDNRVVAAAPAEGRATFTLARDARGIVRLAFEESLAIGEVGRANVEASAIRVGTRPVAPLDAEGWAGPETATAHAHREGLKTRVAGLSIEEVIEALHTDGVDGRVPDHDRWLFRVTGLLRLHPELCAQFAAAALDPVMTPEGQTLALDVLANVGHAQAQAGLRRVLSETDSRGGPAWPRMIQSMLLVQTPDAESVAVLESLYADDPVGRLAAANMLGVAASAAEPAEADRLVDLLASGLDADDPQATAAHLTALGNSRHQRAGALALDWMDADDPAVRHAARRAVRHHADDPDVRRQLLAGLDGGTPNDQRGAVAALLAGGLDAADAQALGAVIEAGAFSDLAVPPLMRALAKGALSDAEALALIDQLRAHTTDPRLRAKLAALQSRRAG